MDKCEVLVHIAAPSGFCDDHRYRAQARAIKRFEAATVTNVYGGSEDVAEAAEEPGTGENTPLFSESLDVHTDIVKETPVQPRHQRLLSKRGGLPASGAPESASTVRGRNTKGLITNKPNPRPVPNPPYKNPLLNRSGESSTIQAVRTPDPARPKTAPSVETALPASNPFAGWTTRKRACSESSSFESISSVVPASQHVHTAVAFVSKSGSSTPCISSSDPSKKKPAILMKHSRGADKEEGAVQKRPRLDDTRTLEEDATVDPSATTKDQPQPFFLRDRSLDWTSSPAPTWSDGTESTFTSTATATPSRSLPEMPYRQSPAQSVRKPLEVYVYHNPTSPINLISQDVCSTPPDRPPPLLFPTAPPSSPPAPPSTPKSTISSLPSHIFPPAPKTARGIYTTHITPVLAVTVTRLPIAKWFRPVHVARDVRVLERGHWRIPITIASPAVVDGARSETPRDQKLAKITRQCEASTGRERWEKRRVLEEARTKRREMGLSSSPLEYGEDGELVERKRQDVWTEEEFVRFWETLEECVGGGRWGWGVKVFREELNVDGPSEIGKRRGRLASSCPPGERDSSHGGIERRVLLKVTTWGEVIPHIWLLLWLMSDKLTAYIPMEWRAADDSMVVKMSGYRRKHGVLGEWVHKGPAGEMGTWGIADAHAVAHGAAVPA